MRQPTIIPVPLPYPWARELRHEALRLGCSEIDLILLAVENHLSTTPPPPPQIIDDE